MLPIPNWCAHASTELGECSDDRANDRARKGVALKPRIFPTALALLPAMRRCAQQLAALERRRPVRRRGPALQERPKLQGNAEIFNLFHRPNVNAIDTVCGSATFLAPPPQHFGDGVSRPANPTFGSPSYVAPARQIQLP